MALILDTNALSAFADGNAQLQQVIGQEDELALPVVVLGEYLFGIRQSRHRLRYEAWLRAHLVFFLMLAIGPDTAERYAEVRAELKSTGQPIPSNDIWIAALARQHGFSIVSHDAHFHAIPGVRVIDW